MNAELLRTAGKLIEAMTELVATECRLVEENRRLRKERRAITAFPLSLSTAAINGRHRAQAMLDAGVRRTVVIHLKYPGDD